MAFSYSFHMSSKGHSVNTIAKVCQVSKHNLREYKSADYDRTQIEILRGSDESILDDVKKLYHDEFDEPLARYNEGKRADRRIDDYLQHVSNSRGDVAVEIIIQVGDMDFWKDKTMDEKKQMSYIFQDQLRTLEKLVPEFKIVSAIIHYDEKSPHMHLVGVPVAEGYKKGLSKQVAKTKVFTAERLSYLQDKMRENAEKGMALPANQNLFKLIELKPKEKGRNKDLPKRQLEKYNELMKKGKEATQRLDSLNESIDSAVLTKEKIEAIKIEKPIVGTKIFVDYQEFESLKKTAMYVDEAKKRENPFRRIIKELKAQIEELKNKLIKKDEVISKKDDEIEKLNKRISVIEEHSGKDGQRAMELQRYAYYLKDVCSQHGIIVPGLSDFNKGLDRPNNNRNL